MKPEHEPCEEHWLLILHIAIVAYFIFATVLAIACWHGLVADGASFFVRVLQRPSIFAPWLTRIFANVITQWPFIVAVKAGVTDMTTLLYVHSFGLYYLGPLQLIFCYLIVPRNKRNDLVWPLISLFASSMNAWFVVITESHVMTFIFWPLVLFMLHGRLDHKTQVLVFLSLVCASLLSYETMAVQGFVLIGFAVWRRGQASRQVERLFWLAVSGWFVLGTGIAIYSILNPTVMTSREDLTREMFRFAGTHAGDLNFPAILSIGALGLIAFLLFGRPVSRKMFLILTAVFSTAAVLAAFTPVLIQDSLDQFRQFHARAWIGVLPAGLAVAMVGFRIQNAQQSVVVFERALVIIGILAFSQITWQNLATAQWRGYINFFQAELSQHKGFIPYEESPIAIQSAGIQVIRRLNWGWTNPSMSIVLAPGGHVSTIFGAPPGGWQPFDPQNPRALPKLAKYGIDYSTYLRTLTSQ